MNFEELRCHIRDGEVLVPGDKGYEESLHRWSATCIKPAAVVVRIATPSEASAAIKFATAHSLPLVVRGGGHSPSGASASAGGMVIDLTRLRTVSVDTQGQTVTFGGGCVWKDVDDALWAEGFATVGGTVDHTGVGGLILGGGYGMLTGRYGLGIDVLLRCEMVLADGEVVTASATENPDLFWAVRGAGESFGVVTSFTSRIFPQGDVWGGVMGFSAAHIPELVAFVNEFVEKTDGDQHMTMMLGSHPKTFDPIVAMGLFFNGGRAEAEAFYAPLLRLESLFGHAGAIPYPKCNTFVNHKVEPGKRYMFSGANFLVPLDPKTVQEASDMFHAQLDRDKEFKARSVIGMEVIPNMQVKAVGTSDTAFAERRGDSYNIFIVIGWENEDMDDVAKMMCAKTSRFLKERGWKGDETGDRGGTYYNYLNPSIDSDRVFFKADRVFGPNVERLRELKLKYDTGNVFKKAVDLMGHRNGKGHSV